MAKATNQGLFELRMQMFTRLQDADLALFKQQSASALGNTLVFEVQNGALLMVSSVMSLVRDSLTLLALVGYLLYLNSATQSYRCLTFSSRCLVNESLKQTFVPNHPRYPNCHR
jgi:subfamily B ATP-binding cassette protein MsbA